MPNSIKSERLLKQIKEYIPDELSSVEKGSRFLQWCLFNIFDKTENELDDDDIENESGVLITDGSGDKGIDAAFVFKGALHIIQTKYGSSHSVDNVHAFITKMVNLLSGDENSDGDRIHRISNLIFDSESNIFDVQFFYITDNDIDSSIFQSEIKRFEDAMPELCGKSCRMRVIGIDQITDYQDEMVNSIPERYKGLKADLVVERYFENRDQTTIVAEVALKNLALFVKRNKEYLFYSNIRNFLGKSGRINKAMANTFKEHPKNFWYYNNGVTIVCDDYCKTNDYQYEIITPQIVNGCQTVNVIYTQWDALRKNKQAQNNIDGTILVKIIKDTNNKRKEITRYTNSQNAVAGKDFFALETFQRELNKAFANLGYNYEIQRNADILKDYKSKIKGNSRYDYLFDRAFNKRHTIVAKEAVQAYISGMLLSPAKAKKIGDFVPGGQYYDSTFNDNTPTDPRFFLFPYAIMYYGNNTLLHKKDNKQRASNLLFVSVYFRLVLRMFQILGLLSDIYNNVYEIPDIIKPLDKLFTNSKTNIKIIELANEIMIDQIFDDTAITEMIGDNLPRFLKNTIENEKVVKIINDKIENRLNKPSVQNILTEVKSIF